jgi:hypothetical protein
MAQQLVKVFQSQCLHLVRQPVSNIYVVSLLQSKHSRSTILPGNSGCAPLVEDGGSWKTSLACVCSPCGCQRLQDGRLQCGPGREHPPVRRLFHSKDRPSCHAAHHRWLRHCPRLGWAPRVHGYACSNWASHCEVLQLLEQAKDRRSITVQNWIRNPMNWQARRRLRRWLVPTQRLCFDACPLEGAGPARRRWMLDGVEFFWSNADFTLAHSVFSQIDRVGGF